MPSLTYTADSSLLIEAVTPVALEVSLAAIAAKAGPVAGGQQGCTRSSIAGSLAAGELKNAALRPALGVTSSPNRLN